MRLSKYLSEEYKPYRYTYHNNALVLESTKGNVVIKKTKKDLFSLFNYLDSRGFTNHPELISFRADEVAYKYEEDKELFKEQKLMDLESVLASLHNKTTFFKNVSTDTYKEIRENILSNIYYLDNYYNMLFNNLLYKEYHSPSEYLFLRNYYKINQALNTSKDKLSLWYEIVSNKDKQRVAIVHNNLSLDHFIESDRNTFISWDNYICDTPILDFIHLYQKEYLNVDFTEFLEKYLKHYELLEDEKLLLYILLIIPLYFEIDNSFNGTKIIKEKLDYLFITEKLISPYITE